MPCIATATFTTTFTTTTISTTSTTTTTTTMYSYTRLPPHAGFALPLAALDLAEHSHPHPLPQGYPQGKAPRNAKRTTKTAQKLTLFPMSGIPDVGVASTGIPDIRDTDTRPDTLPRITAYCTCSSLAFDPLLSFLAALAADHDTAPRKYDEVIYSQFANISPEYPTFAPHAPRPVNRPRYSARSQKMQRSRSRASKPAYPLPTDPIFNGSGLPGVLGIPGVSAPPQPHPSQTPQTYANQAQPQPQPQAFQSNLPTPIIQSPSTANLSDMPTADPSSLAKSIAPVGELFFFDYGVVVMWGFTVQEESQILNMITKFQEEPLPQDQIQTESFHFHYSSTPLIYNDIITLKNPNPMVKLTISHAIAQSVKLTLFEQLVDTTIDNMKHIPKGMAETGKIDMKRCLILFLSISSFPITSCFLNASTLFSA